MMAAFPSSRVIEEERRDPEEERPCKGRRKKLGLVAATHDDKESWRRLKAARSENGQHGNITFKWI